MARISSVVLMRQPVFHVLGVRKTINFMEEYAAFAGDAFQKILGRLDALGELPADAPVVCFHNMELEKLDVEIFFPVSAPLSGDGGVIAGMIPAGKVVSAIDQGPYEQQDPTLEELFAWIRAKGYEAQGEIYYQYLNDPDRPASELLTKMILPLK